MSRVDEFYIHGAEYPDLWSVEKIVKAEIIRLAKINYLALKAASRKKRLGREASSVELSQDRKRCNRIAHQARTQERAWLSDWPGRRAFVVKFRSGEKEALDRLSGVIEWEEQVLKWNEGILERTGLVVSWAIDMGQRRFANRALNRYLNEMDRMTLCL